MKHKYPVLSFLLTIGIFICPYTEAQKISLEMVQKYFLFSAERLEGLRSMNDGTHYTLLENNHDILKYSYLSGELTDTVFSLDWIEHTKLPEISSYSFSDDEKLILFGTEVKRIYRYSFLSDYYVYNMETKILTPVFSEGPQQLVTLSPDGKNAAFVFKDNLYLKNIITSKLTRVTTDGLMNSVMNACPDWVYEEEFTLKTGYYWSPDSRKIAYYRFNESEVKEYTLTYYNDLYPELYTYKYPKAGEKNPEVRIFIYELAQDTAIEAETYAYSDYYIPRIKWLPNSEELCITVLNRLQNHADLLITGASDGMTRIFYSEENEKFISEFTDDFVNFVDSGRNALIMSEKDGFMHLYRYSMDGKLLNQVTTGDWEVDEILGIDEKNARIYYTSTEISPLERQVYCIKFDGSEKQLLSPGNGTGMATFSKTFDYYILEWSDANTPYEYTLHSGDGTYLRSLIDNSFLKEVSRYYQFVPKEFFTYTANDGTEINAFRILPPNFKKFRKYPVLVYVYGGPEEQDVIDKWDYEMAWFQYLAQKGLIIVCADNRGTNGRGEEFAKSTYLQLGKLETEDQATLAEFLASQPYVDKKRIGIFGWSYGGYMSLLCMMKAAHLFSFGIAVGPVTNWKFYDTIYTERFMRRPQENDEGYEMSSPLNYVNQLEGDLLLIHGSYDDNVHLQNTMELVDRMVEENKDFELLIYPDQNHHMDRGNARYHLYETVDLFLNKHLR